MSVENRAHPERRIKLIGWAAACATVGIFGVVALSGSLWGAHAERSPDQQTSGVAGTSESKGAAVEVAGNDEPRLHDEVQYFGDKFSKEQQRLHLQPVTAHVQAF